MFTAHVVILISTGFAHIIMQIIYIDLVYCTHNYTDKHWVHKWFLIRLLINYIPYDLVSFVEIIIYFIQILELITSRRESNEFIVRP